VDVEPLPQVGIGMIIGLLEMLEDVRGKEDIFKLAGSLSMELDDIGPVIEAGKQLKLIQTDHGDITLTDLGSKLLNADINERKDILADCVQQVPFFAEVWKMIHSKRNKQVRRDQVIEYFERQMPDDEAELIFNTVIDWGRFAELIDYDDMREVIYESEDEE
jgi:hypothetical protein